MTSKRIIRLAIVALAACAPILLIGALLSRYLIPNPVWGVFSGYYAYDPQRQSPPAGLFLNRVEPSLNFFLDATLKACDGHYPTGQSQSVSKFEIQRIEYLGKSSYHASALVHVLLTYADDHTAVAVLRFEAGHNESYMLESSVVNAGAWMVTQGLVVPDNPVPPGWDRYPGGVAITTCIEAGLPNAWYP
jgi:hypothetical protein